MARDEARLSHVVAERHHQRVVHLALAILRGERQRRRPTARRVHVDDHQILGELAAHRDEPAGRVVDEALAVERDDVLAVVRRADGVDVQIGLPRRRMCARISRSRMWRLPG